MLLKRIISSQQFLDQTYRDLTELLKRHGYFRIEVRESQRTTDQNSLYWKWIMAIAPVVNEKWNLGWAKGDEEKERTHDLMRHLHIGYRYIPKMGNTQIPEQLKSTTELSTSEFSEFLTRIDAWAIQHLGLMLPRREDSEYEKYREANQ